MLGIGGKKRGLRGEKGCDGGGEEGVVVGRAGGGRSTA
jgi:hypothetical protein